LVELKAEKTDADWVGCLAEQRVLRKEVVWGLELAAQMGVESAAMLAAVTVVEWVALLVVQLVDPMVVGWDGEWVDLTVACLVFQRAEMRVAQKAAMKVEHSVVEMVVQMAE